MRTRWILYTEATHGKRQLSHLDQLLQDLRHTNTISKKYKIICIVYHQRLFQVRVSFFAKFGGRQKHASNSQSPENNLTKPCESRMATELLMNLVADEDALSVSSTD